MRRGMAVGKCFVKIHCAGRRHPTGVSALTHSTLSDSSHARCAWGRASPVLPMAPSITNGFPQEPHYPSDVRAVTTSLRDAAGAWPAALWLALAAIVAIWGAGGA